jgi:hypothetical protein
MIAPFRAALDDCGIGVVIHQNGSSCLCSYFSHYDSWSHLWLATEQNHQTVAIQCNQDIGKEIGLDFDGWAPGVPACSNEVLA